MAYFRDPGFDERNVDHEKREMAIAMTNVASEMEVAGNSLHRAAASIREAFGPWLQVQVPTRPIARHPLPLLPQQQDAVAPHVPPLVRLAALALVDVLPMPPE